MSCSFFCVSAVSVWERSCGKHIHGSFLQQVFHRIHRVAERFQTHNHSQRWVSGVSFSVSCVDTRAFRFWSCPSASAGYVHSRVEEEFLWDCKQLGAYSPIVLLNTLLFFCCKYFGFTTVEQHRQLSFAHVMRCTKTNPDNSKTTFLRFYPPISVNEAESGTRVTDSHDLLATTVQIQSPSHLPASQRTAWLTAACELAFSVVNKQIMPERFLSTKWITAVVNSSFIIISGSLCCRKLYNSTQIWVCDATIPCKSEPLTMRNVQI